MQERKKIPSKPRFDYVTKKAYDLLFELGYDKFPITAEQVLEDLSDYIVCLPWSKARDILQSDDPFHLRQFYLRSYFATADKVNAQAVIDKYSHAKDDITKQWLLFSIGISPKEKYIDLTKEMVESSLEPIRVLDLLWNCYAAYTSQIESKSIEYLKLQK